MFSVHFNHTKIRVGIKIKEYFSEFFNIFYHVKKNVLVPVNQECIIINII